jgi:hypothetical protein
MHSCWQFGNELAMARKDQSAAFYLLYTAAGDGTINKCGTCSQWYRKVFTIKMLFLSVSNGFMNAP